MEETVMKNGNHSSMDDIQADPMEALALAVKTADPVVREASGLKLVNEIRYDLINVSRKTYPAFKAEEIADIAISLRFCKLIDAYDPDKGQFRHLYLKQRKAWIIDAIKEIKYGGCTISDDDIKSFNTAQKYKREHTSDTIEDMVRDIRRSTDSECSGFKGLKKLRGRSPEYIRKMLLAETLEDVSLQFAHLEVDPLSENTSMMILNSHSERTHCEGISDIYSLRDAIIEIVNACQLSALDQFILISMVDDLTRESIQAELRERYQIVRSVSWITQRQQKIQRKIKNKFSRQDIHDLTA